MILTCMCKYVTMVVDLPHLAFLLALLFYMCIKSFLAMCYFMLLVFCMCVVFFLIFMFGYPWALLNLIFNLFAVAISTLKLAQCTKESKQDPGWIKFSCSLWSFWIYVEMKINGKELSFCLLFKIWVGQIMNFVESLLSADFCWCFWGGVGGGGVWGSLPRLNWQGDCFFSVFRGKENP